jgi:hypothetical protein
MFDLSEISGGASDCSAARETFSDDLHGRITGLRKRVAQAAAQLHEVADRAFGAMPESGDDSATHPARSGRLGEIIDVVDLLSDQLACLEAEAARFMHIA